MKGIWKSLLAPFLVLAFASLGSAQVLEPLKDSQQFLGSVVDGVYRNDFFGFSISAPSEMYLLSNIEKDMYKQGGIEMLGKHAKNREAFEQAATAEVLILSLADRPPAPGTASLNIAVLRQPAGVTARELCDDARNAFTQHPRFTALTETAPTALAGKQAARVEFKFQTDTNSFLILRYYAVVIRGYSVTFVITYAQPKQLDAFERVLSTLSFVSK